MCHPFIEFAWMEKGCGAAFCLPGSPVAPLGSAWAAAVVAVEAKTKTEEREQTHLGLFCCEPIVVRQLMMSVTGLLVCIIVDDERLATC